MRYSLLLYSVLVLFLLSKPSMVSAQGVKYTDPNDAVKINWLNPVTFSGFEDEPISYVTFQKAVFNSVSDTLLPELVLNYSLDAFGGDYPRLADPVYEEMTVEEQKILGSNRASIDQNATVEMKVVTERKTSYLECRLVPLRYVNGRFERLVSFEMESSGRNLPNKVSGKTQARNFKVNSVLRSGSWHKYGVINTGIQKITFSELKDAGVISGAVASDRLRVFGHAGHVLPYLNSDYRQDDLSENAIRVVDGGDGQFQTGDYIIFYGQGPHAWNYNEADDRFNHAYNYMSDTSYYFLTTDYAIGNPKRIPELIPLEVSESVEVTSFPDYAFYENDLTNLVKSGRRWFGERFNVQKSYTFPFAFPNVVQGSQGYLKYAVAARAIQRSSSFTLDVNGMTQLDVSLPGGVSGGYAADFALYDNESVKFTATKSDFTSTITFNNPSNSDQGWLDYIELNAVRNLVMEGDEMAFRKYTDIDNSVARFSLSGAFGQLYVWDVSDPSNVSEPHVFASGSDRWFKTILDTPKEFVAFNLSADFGSPVYYGQVANQDLHGLAQADYLMVAHPLFKDEAERLAEFHRSHYGYSVHVVTTRQIYNEFSSGAQDITAIKDFVKMFYDRAGLGSGQQPRFLLLFGDASYDYKYRYSANTNFVPSYQSANSWSPTRSYVADDYFGLLDDDERDYLGDKLDIGIGRFPVKTLAEARSTVDKIIRYHEASTFGPWRNWVSFVGDDEDGNRHMQQANSLANTVITNNPDYNVEKILFDAYPQESNPGGQSYPLVNEAINNRVTQGCLFMSYLGHGGELGWSHERVLGVSDIKDWNNKDNLPLFLTATCEFSRYDDPLRTSAGELVLLNPTGGGIALLTTTRLVYSSPNYELANEFMTHVFDFSNGEEPTLGELLVISKQNGNSINYRNFTLLGDPGISLSYPTNRVVTESITDTIRALEEVVVTGYITDRSGVKQTDFSGILYPTVFDKKKTITTLNNDGTGRMSFTTRNSVIYKGRASVTNGEFEFRFMVPRDIGIDFDFGKISYYWGDGVNDAHGNDQSFVIGGFNENAEEDNKGPEVHLWLNDSAFVSGGLTDANPMLLARVYDENGINTVGSGIGHDIVAILDENTADAIVLNDFYEADLDSYKKGQIEYPFSSLTPGPHTLTLKVWDVHNNSGTAETEFVVSQDGDLELDHVLNYPNPFTTSTEFWFEHNVPGQYLEVRISIFTPSGKLVKVIDADGSSQGFRYGPIAWDGLDEFGDKIGRGTYLYKVHVKLPTGESVEVNEKLVIL